MCISTSPHPVSAATAAMAGSDNAVTSLITTAPAATAAAATTAFEVSIETSAPDPASAATTGSTRVISSSASTAEAPGTGALPTDVDQVGTVSPHLQAVGHRGIVIEKVPAIGEGVGG